MEQEHIIDGITDGGGEYGIRTAAAQPAFIEHANVRYATLAGSSAGHVVNLCYVTAQLRAKRAGDASPKAVARQMTGLSRDLWLEICRLGEMAEQARVVTRFFPLMEQHMAYSHWLLSSQCDVICPQSHPLLDITRRVLPDVDKAIADRDAARIVCNVADLQTGREIVLPSKDVAGRPIEGWMERGFDTTSLPFFFRAGRGRYVDGGLLRNGPVDALDDYDPGSQNKRVRFCLGEPDLAYYRDLYAPDAGLSKLIARAATLSGSNVMEDDGRGLNIHLERGPNVKIGLPTRDSYAHHTRIGHEVIDRIIDDGSLGGWLKQPVPVPRKPAPLAA